MESVGVVDAVMGVCNGRPGNPETGCSEVCTAGTCVLVCATPSPDPIPDEIVRSPVCLIIAGGLYCYGVGVYVGIIGPPDEIVFPGIPNTHCMGEDIVAKARETHAAIDRLRQMLSEATTANRRNEIMAAILRLEAEPRRLFDCDPSQ